jgi:NACHT domain
VPVAEDELVAARDVLDGRIGEIPADLSAVARGCVLLVDHLRELAQARLGPRLASAYLLADYFHALCLTALSTVKHPDVAARRFSSRTMLLAAGLSLAFLDEVEGGLYAPGSAERRWLPPRRLAAPSGIETRGAAPAEEPPAARVLLASRRTREALDPYILARIVRPALVDKYLGAIARGLDGDRSRLIPLVGPAGFGKSTLLGTVYDRLSTSPAGWCGLLRCNDLDRTEIDGLSRSMAYALSGVAMSLEDLAASLSAESGKGVLLIDTLDLILAHETLPALRAIFTGLLDRRVTVFVTCRDYEYAILLEPVRDSLPGLADAVDRHQLPGFAPAEVEEAARSFFGSRADLAVRDGGRAFTRRVLELAADGRPMAEITRNPLLLALLCELFGREQHVPPDLTVSKLYDTFWSRKVATSRRYGRDAPEAFAKQEICQRLARDLALGTENDFRDSMFSSDCISPPRRPAPLHSPTS